MSGAPTRRELGQLLGAGLLGGAAAACGQEPEEETSDGRTLVASLKELGDGDSIDFEYPEGHAAFVAKLGVSAEGGLGPDADIVAFHKACPHMGCPIFPDADTLGKGEFGPCVCHFSRFDLRMSGRQIEGRATQRLVRVNLELEGGELYATGIEGVPFGEAPTDG